MRNKFILLITIILFNFIISYSQTTQDTINNPYWIQMMRDRSNNYYDVVRAFDLYFSNKEKIKGSGHKQFERWAHYMQGFINEKGEFFPPDHVIKEYNKFKINNLQPRSSSGNWKNLGPFDIVGGKSITGTGRLNTIGFHPTNQDIMYVGAPQGGLWRTNDKGANWTSSTDNLPTLGVSDIAVLPTPNNVTILIGTGDRDGTSANGLGVYKSTDGGISFTASKKGMGNVTVSKFAINRLDSNTIFACTHKGIFVSYDGGNNWNKKSSNSDEYFDIKYCPNDTNILYASEVGKFYRSIDAGNTWNEVNSGIINNDIGRIEIGVSDIDPNIVYLLIENNKSHGLQGFYKSANKGVSFTLNHSGRPNIMGFNVDGSGDRGQGWFDISMEISPTDVNTVYIGGINIWKSNDGGINWFCISDWRSISLPWVHSDIHYLKFNKLNNELYVCCDGGLYKTTNRGNTFSSINKGLSIGQIYNLGVSQLSKTRFISGFQDNSLIWGSSPSSWTNNLGGDGFHCYISEFDTNTFFGSLQYGNIYRTTDNANNWIPIVDNGNISEFQGPWNTPFELHPRVKNTLIAIYNNIWLSENATTSNRPAFKQLTQNITDQGNAIKISNKKDGLCFFGWRDGNIRYTDDMFAVSPVINTCTKPPGKSWILDIETSYEDENIVYICTGSKVFKSTDKGKTWTSISAGLPRILIRSIVLDKNSNEGLYVGTDAGIYFKDASMTKWQLFNTNMPVNSRVTDLKIVYDTICSSNSKIYASTFGRGLWIGDLNISEKEPKINIDIPKGKCLGEKITLENNSPNTNLNTKWTWTISPRSGVTYVSGTDSNSIFPIITINKIGDYTIKVKASNENPKNGFCEKTYTDSLKIGKGVTGNLKFENIINNEIKICPSDTFLLKATGGSSYQWDTTKKYMTIINDSTAIIYPPSNQTYYIYGSSNGSCFDTAKVSVQMKSIPSYTIKGDSSVCSGDTITYTFTGIDSSIWTPNINLSTNIGNTINIFGISSQNYLITLKEDGKCDVYLRRNIKVLIDTIPNYLQFPDSVLCLGDTTYINETNIPNKEYSSLSRDEFTKIDSNLTFIHPKSNKEIYITTSDSNYCKRIYDSIYIKVNPLPDLKLSGPSEICLGDSAVLIASGANVYQWSPSLYLSSNSSSSSKVIPLDDIVYAIVGSKNNCSKTITHSIKVGKEPVEINIEGISHICKGNSTDLIATGGSEFIWSPAYNVHNRFSHKVRVQSDTSFSLTVIGKNIGCYDTMTIPIKVFENPSISFTQNKTEICEGDTVKISASGTDRYYISPLLNSNVKSKNSFEIFPKNDSSFYSLYGIDTNNCKDKKDILVLVHPLPKLKLNRNSVNLKYNESFSFNASGADVYKWTPRDYIIDSSQDNRIVVRPNKDFVYYLKGTSDEGCVSNTIAIVYVEVNHSDTSEIDSSSMINNRNLAYIKIYPNPVKDILNITSSKDMVKLNLYNNIGERVLRVEELKIKHELNLDALSQGIYMLEVIDSNFIKRFIRIQINR